MKTYKSDTPRTDKEVHENGVTVELGEFWTEIYIDPEFARKLEKELTDAKTMLAASETNSLKWLRERDQAITERNKLKSKLLKFMEE